MVGGGSIFTTSLWTECVEDSTSVAVSSVPFFAKTILIIVITVMSAFKNTAQIIFSIQEWYTSTVIYENEEKEYSIK